MSTAYANTISLDGGTTYLPIYADRAEKDQNGDNIEQTYAKKSGLATVATSGDYDDLTNKPSIPAAQVNADWNASSGVAEILNKPANLVQDASYVHTDNNFTTSLKDKLDGIASGAEVNVQANWNQTDNTADDYIQNKPTIHSYTAGAGIEIDSSDKISRKIQYVTPSMTYSTIRSIIDNGDQPVLAIEAGSYHNYLVCTHKSGTHIDFVGNAEPHLASGSPEGSDGLIKVSVSNANQWTITQLLPSSFGTAGQVLAMNSGANGTEWVNPPQNQVNADWNATSGVAEILNKPANLVQDASYVHTDNNFTTSLKDKLDGIASGAEVNVQADWNESNSASDAYIQNKPTINNVPAVTSADADKVLKASYSGGVGSYSWEQETAQVQSDWTESNTADPAYIQNKPTEKNLVAGANITITEAGNNVTVATTVNGVPGVTSTDTGKYLKADYNGGSPTVSWDIVPTNTYTGGNMISISSNVVGVSTTAGITDIQVVSALPASPVSTVLYLIQET